MATGSDRAAPPARKAPPPGLGIPSAMQRQVANASGRWDDSSSSSSWVPLELETPPAHGQSLDPVPERETVDQPPVTSRPDVQEGAQPEPQPKSMPPPPPPAAYPAQNTAPVNQAARGLLDHANEPPMSRRLRRQQEQAARRGRRGVHWGQMAPGNLGNENERSVLIVDGRDCRVQSPFQGWLLDEVLTNALAYTNIRSDRNLVRAPTSGYHFSLFMAKTLDAMGADADRLELRFLSAGDRLDIAASSVQVPPSWLVVSRVSGPTLIRNAKWCREHGARVECPDQQLQMSQLAAIHAHWTAATEAPTERETGPRVSAIAVESNPINVHLVCESPLFRKERALVKPEALALQCHNPLDEVAAAVVPPLIDGPAVRPVDQAPKFAPALTGPVGETIAATPVSSAKPSLTTPGQLPQPGSSLTGSLVPPRRTLEQRRGDSLDCSAMTRWAFVEAARRPWWPVPGSQESQVTIEEVNTSSIAQPKSFAPPKPEVTEV